MKKKQFSPFLFIVGDLVVPFSYYDIDSRED